MTNATWMETVREEARKCYPYLEKPHFVYGLGMSVSFDEINWEEVEAALRTASDSIFTIRADPRVKLLSLSALSLEQQRTWFAHLIPSERTALTALHYASLTEVKVLVIPRGMNIEKPIYLTSTPEKATAEHLIILAEPNSKAAIIETTQSDTSYFLSQYREIYAQPGSQLLLCSLQALPLTSYQVAVKHAHLQRDAEVSWIELTTGGKIAQISIQSRLTEPGAKTCLRGAFCGSASQLFDLNAEAVHHAPHTQSVLLHKGVLNDTARVMFRGRVKIENQAVNVSGHQRSDTLLLGEEARCDGVPVLDVENDQVSCSHGSTMGPLDEEQLYYLQSRGITKTAATHLLVQGFLEPILREMPDEKVREQMTTLIGSKIATHEHELAH